MDLGIKLKQARLEAGLSQRQLCGDEITRNMLSQIENGSARPSMATLSYLAARLGKPVSFFLDEDAVTSPNLQVMDNVRRAWEAGDLFAAAKSLEAYRSPDPVFDREKMLLDRLTRLALAEKALSEGRTLYAAEILEQLGTLQSGYCGDALERQRLLLSARAMPARRREICRELPSLDGELLLRARNALDMGQFDRSEHLLEAAENKETPDWNFLRGEVHLAREQFAEAAACYHRAETTYPGKTAPRLERCYRELENFKKAYEYACKQK